MSDYIRREDAICLIKHYLDNPPKNHSQLFIDGMEDAYYRMLSNLNNFPSADVVQVVRCKDCKHYYFADNRIPQEQRYVCEINGEIWKPDSFCSYGEREE